MKKYAILSLLILFSTFAFSQQNYKLVIVPTEFSDIGKGFNPYGISSSIQRIFNEKGIANVFESDGRPLNFCDALTLDLENTSNMFKNKLTVKLIDCNNKVVWKKEGTGMSKEYAEGFAEAFEDAVADLKELPENNSTTTPQSFATTKPENHKKKPEESRIKPQVTSITRKASENTDMYRPQNLYYNYQYFVDLLPNEDGTQQLLLINGELLGYKNLQIIGKLSPSRLDNVYTVSWTTADGTILSGLANLEKSRLKISLQDGDAKKVISLFKY